MFTLEKPVKIKIDALDKKASAYILQTNEKR